MKRDTDIGRLLRRARTLGMDIIDIDTYCKHTCYLLKTHEDYWELLIPDDVKQLNSLSGKLFKGWVFSKKLVMELEGFTGKLHVIGGKGLISARGMFHKCKSLKSIDLSNLNTSSILNMGYMFNECGSLEHLDMRNINTGSVRSMYHMFYNCSSLEYIDISNFDMGSVIDVSGMFNGCKSLKSIGINSFDISGIEKSDAVFDGCESLILSGVRYVS